MSQAESSKQLSFRLPHELVERVEACADHMRATGLDVSRADVVRLLLKHALDATKCRLELILRSGTRGAPAKRRRQ